MSASRAHVQEVVATKVNGDEAPLGGASVYVYNAGTTVQVTGPIYSTRTGGTTLSQPLTADANGVVEFWLPAQQTVDLAASLVGYSAVTVTSEAVSGSSPNLSDDIFKSGGLLLYGWLPPLQNVKYVPIRGANLVTGNNDLYTVPAGRKACITTGARAYNTNATTAVIATGQIKVGGSYYTGNQFGSMAALTAASANWLAVNIVLNAGEAFSINVSTASYTGLNVAGYAIEFDASDTRLGTARVLGLASGDNTILTVPAGTSVMGATALHNQVLQVEIFTVSGANYITYEIPSGGAKGTGNQLYPSNGIAANTSSGFPVGNALASGDVILLNASAGSAADWAYITFYQVP